MRILPIVAALVPAVLAAAAAAAEDSPTGAPADWGVPMMGNQTFAMVMLERLEYGFGEHRDSRLWEAAAWYGGDRNKVYLETEGEGATGEALEAAELELLYDRSLTAFWSWRAGVRHDLRPGEPDVSYAAFGLQGLAPQWFETDLAAFVSEDGDVSLRAELEYDLLLTRRLVLQPRLEVNASLDDVPELGLGSGIGSTEAGLRLRYEIVPELAPYVGIRWSRLHGGTRDLARIEDEPVDDTAFVVGLRAWW